MRQSRREATVLGWLQALPDGLFQVRPVLCAAYASTLLVSGRLEGVEARLRDAERWLDTTADRGAMVVVDEVEWGRLPGEIQGEPFLRGTADMCVGLGEIHRERNDLHAATQLQLQSTELGTFAGLPQNPYRWC